MSGRRDFLRRRRNFDARGTFCVLSDQFDKKQEIYSVSQKNPPCGFLKFFPKLLGIFNQLFTHLLHDHFYTRVQIFIQISPSLTKLCHTKRDHLAKFYISLEL